MSKKPRQFGVVFLFSSFQIKRVVLLYTQTYGFENHVREREKLFCGGLYGI